MFCYCLYTNVLREAIFAAAEGMLELSSVSKPNRGTTFAQKLLVVLDQKLKRAEIFLNHLRGNVSCTL